MTKNTDSELLNFPSFPPGSSVSLPVRRQAAVHRLHQLLKLRVSGEITALT